MDEHKKAELKHKRQRNAYLKRFPVLVLKVDQIVQKKELAELMLEVAIDNLVEEHLLRGVDRREQDLEKEAKACGKNIDLILFDNLSAKAVILWLKRAENQENSIEINDAIAVWWNQGDRCPLKDAFKRICKSEVSK